jgi:hypothetical protein
MAHLYFDSSALVKLYIAETGTGWLQGLCAPTAGHAIYTARISGAEIVAALFRRARTGALSLSDAQTVSVQFKSDFHGGYQVVEVTEALVDRAMALAEKHGLRGYDAVQLAAALELQTLRALLSLSSVTFISADDTLNSAAIAEGLIVDNPNSHP